MRTASLLAALACAAGAVAAQAKPAAPAPAKPAAATPAAATPPARADSAARADSGTQIVREVFSYEGGGRDPFVSLLTSSDVRPLFTDLKLVGIYYDAAYPSRSVAVLRDVSTGKRYRAKPGDILGRLKVAQIRPRQVTFTVQEFGFEHQESLTLAKQEETP